MKVTKLIMTIGLFIISTTVVRSQEVIDSTAKKDIPNEEVQKTDYQKPETKKGKGKKKDKTADSDSTGQATKPEGKKKGKGSRMDQILAEKKAQEANGSDSTQANNKKKGKSNPKKPAKVEPIPEPKIIPGAEAKANAETKDKEDRTMKGPSGQKVYSSPKGGKYYFDVNGNKKYLRRDNQK